MTTPLTDLLKCPRDGGGTTGMLLCSARIDCSAGTITDDNGFSSVTDYGTGDFIAHFTNAFAATPMCWAIAEGTGDAYITQIRVVSTTQVRVMVFNDGGAVADPTAIHVFALGA